LSSLRKVKLIVGLGNPGREYRGTRHNVGFEVIDALAKRYRIPVRSKRNKALVGEGLIAGEPVVLAKPRTFMNLSGTSVAGLARRYRLTPEEVLVIVDDVNLPLGRLRIRPRGSAGGHKGLKSIIRHLGSEEFARLRMGIGSPNRAAVDYVLSKFKRAERSSVRAMVRQAADAVTTFLAEGIESAMNEFNAPT